MYNVIFVLISLFSFFIPSSCHLIIVFVTDQVQGTVTIRNISALSSGLYQCVASNAIGTSTCLLDLQVVSRKYITQDADVQTLVKSQNAEFFISVLRLCEE